MTRSGVHGNSSFNREACGVRVELTLRLVGWLRNEHS
jgi:hypothetical protein